MNVIYQQVDLCLRCAAMGKIKFSQRKALFLRLLSEADPIIVLKALVAAEVWQQFLALSSTQVKQVMYWLETDQHYLVHCLAPEYPEYLNQCHNPPFYLLIAGDWRSLHRPQLAIVGSRNCSWYGKRWCHDFSTYLCQHGLVITSGLALGIDAIAHQAALTAQGTTVAILGSGFNHLYPPQHCGLVRSIIEQGGAVVSEFLLDVAPKAKNFPRRNRVISGLSLGTLVVEATLNSGSLITARYALEQNRNLYAIPGALGNPMSAGGHWLIQQGAMLVTQPQDILDDLEIGYRSVAICPTNQIKSSKSHEVSLPFAEVLATVEDDVTSVDVVAARLNQPVNQVLVSLLELELTGWIAAVPGGYVRIRRAGHV